MWVPGADLKRDNIVNRLRGQADVCLHEDPERLGLMQNWLSAARCAQKDNQEWAIILSDDAAPLQGWKEYLPLALKYSPEPFLGLTHFGGYGERAVDKGAAYCIGPYLIWGGACAIRRDQLDGLIEFAEFHHARGYKHDDVLICAYASSQGHQTAMAAHAIFGQPVKASLLNHNTPIRSPYSTIEDDSANLNLYSKGLTKKTPRGISPKNELTRLVSEFLGEDEESGWKYGEGGSAFPVQPGEVWSVGEHIFVCSDLMESSLFEDLSVKYSPTVVYCDPPWGQGLANAFRTKAGLGRASYDWKDIYREVARLGHLHEVPIWVEGSEITREFGAPVPSLIGLPDGGTERGYWTISYMGGNPAGLFYAHSQKPPVISEKSLVGFKGVREVLFNYSGRVMDACSGLGGIALEAQHVGLTSVNNELSQWRMSAAMFRMRELTGQEPKQL